LKTERLGILLERAMWRDFSKTVAEFWRASGEPCSAYRPDKHYMRGPGPKWHAKYDSLCKQTASSPAPKSPAPNQVAEQHA
jgi:hypothetical protein